MKKQLNKGHPIIIADIEATNGDYALNKGYVKIKTIQFSNIINWRCKNAVNFVNNFDSNIIVEEGNIDPIVDKKLRLNVIEVAKGQSLLMKFVEYIKDNYGDCYVFFINGRNYDIEFLHSEISIHKDSFDEINYIVNDLKHYFQLSVKYEEVSIKFRDTLNLFGGHSLIKWLRTFESEEVWEQISYRFDIKKNIDHSVWNAEPLILTEELKRYCIGDILIPALYFWRDYQTPKGIKIGDKEFPRFPLSVLQQKELPITTSSFSMALFEKLYNKMYGKVFPVTTNKKGKEYVSLISDNKVFERDFIGTSIEGKTCECEDKKGKAKRRCHTCNFNYHIKPYAYANNVFNDNYVLTNEDVRSFGYAGGITLNKGNQTSIKGMNIDNNVWIDRVSMYPAVIVNYPFPYGEPMTKRIHKTNIPYYILFISKLKLKKDRLPIIPSKNLNIIGLCGNSSHKYIENYEGEPFRLDILTDDYLKWIEYTYDIEYKIYKTFYFKATVRHQSIMKAIYMIKEEAKREGNFAKAQTSKLAANGFYGKMGQKYFSTNPVWSYEEHSFRDEEETEMPIFNIIFAAMTTTYARMDLLNGIYKLGYENFEYCDTDSIHTRNLTIEEIKSKLPIGNTLGDWEDQSIFSADIGLDDKNRVIKEKYELIASKHIKAKCYVKIGYSKNLNNYICLYTIAGVNDISLPIKFDNLDDALLSVWEDFNIDMPIGTSSGTVRIRGGKVIKKDEKQTIITDSNGWCNHTEENIQLLKTAIKKKYVKINEEEQWKNYLTESKRISPGDLIKKQNYQFNRKWFQKNNQDQIQNLLTKLSKIT